MVCFSVHFTAFLSADVAQCPEESTPYLLNMPLSEIEAGAELCKTVFLKFVKPARLKLAVKVSILLYMYML